MSQALYSYYSFMVKERIPDIIIQHSKKRHTVQGGFPTGNQPFFQGQAWSPKASAAGPGSSGVGARGPLKGGHQSGGGGHSYLFCCLRLNSGALFFCGLAFKEACSILSSRGCGHCGLCPPCRYPSLVPDMASKPRRSCWRPEGLQDPSCPCENFSSTCRGPGGCGGCSHGLGRRDR